MTRLIKKVILIIAIITFLGGVVKTSLAAHNRLFILRFYSDFIDKTGSTIPVSPSFDGI
jgi:hypothetical protein